MREVRVRRGTAAEIAAKRRRAEPMLSCHVVRPTGPNPAGIATALGTFDDPSRAREIAQRTPRGSAPREIARELRVAVIGELRVTGGVAQNVKLAKATAGMWDLGATFRKKA